MISIFKFAVVVFYLIAQMSVLAERDISVIFDKCSAQRKEPDNQYSSELPLCILTAMEILNNNGAVNKKNLEELLLLRYKNQTFVNNLIDLCAVEQPNPGETAYYVFYTCWITPYESLEDAKHMIAFLSCWYPKYKSSEKIKAAQNDIYKCFLEKINIMDKNGEVNKEAVLQIMKASENKKLTDAVIEGCVTKKENPLETANNIWKCINM
ncbi:hypothetical protein WA026_009421 [Henosepilachna vigintioctopunctata]|uniref:Uncharacterized protein n=1 Tax=Henosepilachna vigintioctopunctata TaxID=420089 RepID=A0AAW1TVM7_9CUCU